MENCGLVRRVIPVGILLMLLGPGLARAADGGAWTWVEYRQPVVGDHTGVVPRVSLRLFTDTRLMGAAGGLAQQFIRVGPIFDIQPWFYVALHGTVYADRRPTGLIEPEARLEVEPNFSWRLGPLTFNDRNRMEYRFRESGRRARYRNQLRVSYAPPGARWIPFVWNEWLVDTARGYNENRLAGGIGRMLASHVRLEVAYLYRTREIAEVWQHDHIALLYLFVGVPPPSP